jgi:hypothetical protein
MLTRIGAWLADWFHINQLRGYHAQLGPARFWAMLAVTFAWIGVWVWLSFTASWPGKCDREGRKLLGLVKELRCSPDLLAGGPTEWALFAFHWTVHTLLVLALIWRGHFECRKWRRNRAARILPLED